MAVPVRAALALTLTLIRAALVAAWLPALRRHCRIMAALSLAITLARALSPHTSPGASGPCAAAWPFSPQAPALALTRYKCHYRSMVILQGRSAWLDHLKMELACGSLVVFATDRKRPDTDRMRGREPAYAYFSHLLKPGLHYVHIDADSSTPSLLANPPRLPSHLAPVRRGSADGGGEDGGGEDLCGAVASAHRWAMRYPAHAACIGARAKEVVAKWMRMQTVWRYMASVLLALAKLQAGASLQAAVPNSPWFVPLDLTQCVRVAAEVRARQAARGANASAAPSIGEIERSGPLACVGAAVEEAVSRKNATAYTEAHAPVNHQRDWWLE